MQECSKQQIEIVELWKVIRNNKRGNLTRSKLKR